MFEIGIITCSLLGLYGVSIPIMHKMRMRAINEVAKPERPIKE